MDIKLTYPIYNFSWSASVSQLFGVNRSYYQPRYGVPGHQGADFIARNEKRGYGEKILAMHKGTVESVAMWSSSGNGVYVKSEDGLFSTGYWHASMIFVAVGQRVEAGQEIAAVGNSGDVFPKKTVECPFCGSHVHINLRVRGAQSEYGSFVDPIPCMFRHGDKLPIAFGRNLMVGSAGDDVSWLKSVLRIEGFAPDFMPIGYYGLKTQRDVAKLQSRYDISPALG